MTVLQRPSGNGKAKEEQEQEERVQQSLLGCASGFGLTVAPSSCGSVRAFLPKLTACYGPNGRTPRVENLEGESPMCVAVRIPGHVTMPVWRLLAKNRKKVDLLTISFLLLALSNLLRLAARQYVTVDLHPLVLGSRSHRSAWPTCRHPLSPTPRAGQPGSSCGLLDLPHPHAKLQQHLVLRFCNAGMCFSHSVCEAIGRSGGHLY